MPVSKLKPSVHPQDEPVSGTAQSVDWLQAEQQSHESWKGHNIFINTS